MLLTYSRLPQGEKFRNLGRHEHREGYEMQPRQHLRQPLEVTRQRLKQASHPKLRSTTQRRGKSTKHFFASGSLTTYSSMPAAFASSMASLPV